MSEEDKKQRVNRELIELLNELRVALPGVQVLFAFLLVVPFSQGFTNVTSVEKDVYFATFLCTALSTVLLIAPSSYHRLHFRAPDKERLLFTSNRLAIAGLGSLAGAVIGVVFLISDFLFDPAVAGVTTAVAAAVFAYFWYALPLLRRASGRAEAGAPGSRPGGD